METENNNKMIEVSSERKKEEEVRKTFLSYAKPKIV